MNKTLIIYGPTATGKTDLAISLAKKYNGELISADSRQVYKGLDIGTGKVSFDSKVEKHQGFWIVDGVKIHGFDLADPEDQFTVADFLKSASTSLFRISEVNKLPIIVGGTGFYIKSLIDGIDSIGIPQDPKLRPQLEKLTVGKLYQKLLKIDPERALKMNQSDRANPRRLIRAIEIALASQKSKVKGQNYGSSRQVYLERSRETRTIKTVNCQLSTVNCFLIGLTAPNPYLYERADKWLSKRLANGLIEEVQNLINQNVSPQWLDNLGLEYRWITRYLLDKITKEEAIDRLKGDIHNFIRRQKAWFRQFPSIRLFDISKTSWRQELDLNLYSHL